MTDTVLAQRDRAEMRRSAEEAKNVVLRPSQVERYLNPPRNTAYPLEYAITPRAQRVFAGATIITVKETITCIRLNDIDPRRSFRAFLERIGEKNKCREPAELLARLRNLLIKKHALLGVGRFPMSAAGEFLVSSKPALICEARIRNPENLPDSD